MLSNHSRHVPLLVEHYKTWEVQTRHSDVPFSVHLSVSLCLSLSLSFSLYIFSLSLFYIHKWTEKGTEKRNVWMPGTNLPFQESLVSRTIERSWQMYIFEVCFHYHILNGMLRKHLFLYFPHACVLLFLVRPFLYDSSAKIWCFLTILALYH